MSVPEHEPLPPAIAPDRRGPLQVFVGADDQVIVRGPDLEVHALGAIELPRREAQLLMGADGGLAESAPVALLHLREGSALTADGAQQLRAGVYAVTPSYFARICELGEENLVIDLSTGAPRVLAAVADGAGNAHPERAAEARQLPGPTHLTELAQLEADALRHSCYLLQRDPDERDVSNLDVRFAVLMERGGYSDQGPEQIAAAEQEVDHALDQLAERGLMVRSHEQAGLVYWRLSEAGWQLLADS